MPIYSRHPRAYFVGGRGTGVTHCCSSFTDGSPTYGISGTHESSTANDGFSVLLHDVLAEGLDDCHQLLMLSCRHLVLVKGL